MSARTAYALTRYVARVNFVLYWIQAAPNENAAAPADDAAVELFLV